MQRIRVGIIGAGFVGHAHVEALCRLGSIDVAGVADVRLTAAKSLAQEFGIDRATADYRHLLADPALQAVHICTPNGAHFAVAEAALRAGKHVVCEKPLALTTAEARQLVSLAEERQRANCTCFNLRYYPLVRQMRCLRESGELGDVLVVQGSYSQDWLLYDTDWNWRLDPGLNGRSRALADIGSHWCDMAEFVAGLPIRSVCAEIQTFHAHRRRPVGEAETFRQQTATSGEPVPPVAGESVPMATEDFGSCLFHLGERARGAFTVSQMAAGRKNQLRIEVHGSRASVSWDQEQPNRLWLGSRDQCNGEWIKSPAMLPPPARALADYPAGHAEGYPDTFKQLFRHFYASLGTDPAARDYPQFTAGLRQLQILDAELESHRTRRWQDVAAPE